MQNNSVWSYRYFLNTHFVHFDLKEELAYLLNSRFLITKLQIVPENESAWNYLNGYSEYEGFFTRRTSTTARSQR